MLKLLPKPVGSWKHTHGEKYSLPSFVLLQWESVIQILSLPSFCFFFTIQKNKSQMVFDSHTSKAEIQPVWQHVSYSGWTLTPSNKTTSVCTKSKPSSPWLTHSRPVVQSLIARERMECKSIVLHQQRCWLLCLQARHLKCMVVVVFFEVLILKETISLLFFREKFVSSSLSSAQQAASLWTTRTWPEKQAVMIQRHNNCSLQGTRAFSTNLQTKLLFLLLCHNPTGHMWTL